MHSQIESGSTCPTTMTKASIPLVRINPQLNAALGPELTFLGATLNAKGFTSWFGAVFVMVTGFALFELCRRQFVRQWSRIQEEIEHEIKRGEAL